MELSSPVSLSAGHASRVIRPGPDVEILVSDANISFVLKDRVIDVPIGKVESVTYTLVRL